MEDYGQEDDMGDMDPEMRRVMELSRVTAQNDELKRMQSIKQQVQVQEKIPAEDKPFNFGNNKVGGDDIDDFNFEK